MAEDKSEHKNLISDGLDRDLINLLQTDFPLSVRPYREIGERLGLSEQEVIERLARLRENGVIRRIGANVSPKKIGYTSTLCAARVPWDRVDEFAETVNRNPGVTHNYVREHDYNVWFTIIAPSVQTIESFLEQVKQETGVTDILNMPATRVFKLKAEFIV